MEVFVFPLSKASSYVQSYIFSRCCWNKSNPVWVLECTDSSGCLTARHDFMQLDSWRFFLCIELWRWLQHFHQQETFFLSEWQTIMQAKTHVYLWWTRKSSSVPCLFFWPRSLSLWSLKGSKGKCGQLLPFDLQGLSSSHMHLNHFSRSETCSSLLRYKGLPFVINYHDQGRSAWARWPFKSSSHNSTWL